jgi:ABC-type lipoprotein export system ATPase subunit
VAIARALVNSPQLILADEPTGALDSQTSEDIMNLLTELNKTGMTVVLVTHEADIAAWARRKIVFKDGHIIEDVSQRGGQFFDEPPLEKLTPSGGSAAHEVASVGVIFK